MASDSIAMGRSAGAGLDAGGYTPSDPYFGRAFIDIDEVRTEGRAMRYVHGGFEGTHTRFSFYFPPLAQYRGRFFQYLEGGAGGHENLLMAGWQPGIALDWVFGLAMDELGGYLVESNQGHFPGEGTGFGNAVELYGASAETALFGRYLAAQIYGSEPAHGYIWGVSGGGARSGHCLEARPDIWHGGAPHAGIGQGTHWSPWAQAWLLAKDRFPQLIDAMEPGGSGDPFAGLSHVQREAVAELYRRGYPRGAENQLDRFVAWAFPMYGVIDSDPDYFRDFWTAPGYLGADDPAALAHVTLTARAKVSEVFPASQVDNVFAQMYTRFATAGANATDPAWGVKLDLKAGDPDLMFMSKVTILTGKAAGRELLICGVDDGVISPFSERTPDVFEDVEPGDEVLVDNSDFVAFCFYHRHAIGQTGPGGQGIDPTLDGWAVDGRPAFPQRPVAPFSQAASTSYTGDIASKMIYVQPTLDNMVWPTTITPYHRLVQEKLGDRIDEHFRLWFVENACHGAPDLIGANNTQERTPAVWFSRLVQYDGVTSEALRQVVRWVEEGVAPARYKGYQMTRDNALVLPSTAAARGGVQPVVAAQANGGVRAEVKVGEPVTFTGQAEQPAGAGTIVAAEWDFDSQGRWQADASVGGASASISVAATHAFDKPGTYFPAFRVGAHSQGAGGRGLAAQNLARVRVVVS